MLGEILIAAFHLDHLEVQADALEVVVEERVCHGLHVEVKKTLKIACSALTRKPGLYQ